LIAEQRQRLMKLVLISLLGGYARLIPVQAPIVVEAGGCAQDSPDDYGEDYRQFIIF
jgi:hypothetical protein